MKSGIDLAAMDTTVRPQDDLFGYVNGTWAAQTEIPGDRGRYGTFDVLREAAESDLRDLIEEAAAAEDAQAGTAKRKVGDLFASFMDEGRVERLGIDPVREDLDAVAAVQDKRELLGLLGRLQRHGVDGFVQVFVSTDDRASDRYVVYLEQDGLGLPDESYYREEQYADTRAAYLRHVAAVLGLAGVEHAEGTAGRIMALETRLAGFHWDTVTTRDAVKSYSKLTRAELADLSPGVDWAAWLEGLGAPEGSFDEVIGRQPTFLTGFSEVLDEESLEDWKDWLAWQVLHSYAPYLSADVVDEHFAFYGKTLSGTPQLRERWKRGVALVEQAIGEAAGQLYVERHFPPEAKARMQELVANLVEAYRRDFQSLPWMGQGTRERALEKLETFRPKIGYPDAWRDYSALTIEPDDLLGNVRRASAFETHRHLSKIGRPVDRDEWFMTPQTVNAYYNPGMNEIVFPAAILQPPFFDVEADDAVNYGGIGGVIGHE
ncbi:MAG TPA: M13-type metalloendopeptidase, partial [Segeticoccus sp.]|nr:M13-type metalloendopeptidase [Segeticoccus sp.]